MKCGASTCNGDGYAAIGHVCAIAPDEGVVCESVNEVM